MSFKHPRPLIIAVLIMLSLLAARAQSANGSKYASSEDSIRCLMDFSTYREFVKYDLFDEAMDAWKKVFSECPQTSQNIYIDGVTLYRRLIDNAPDGAEREGLIDTLMLIYDRRMQYFGGEGNVLGRKGRDLLAYRKADIDQVQLAYDMLKRSIEIEGTRTRDAVMLNFVSAGLSLNKNGKINDDQFIADYFMLTDLLDQLQGRSSRWERTQATIDEIMLKEGILTCEALNGYFQPQFEPNKENQDFLEKLVRFYTAAGCDRANLYAEAAETLYHIEPGAESAHNLGLLFIARNDFSKASYYLKMATLGEELDTETRALWFYELAVVSLANKEYCEAIEYAREAIANKSDYGKAYLTLGDAVIGSRVTLSDDFQKSATFWVAADYYAQAASADPAVAEEANQKLNDYKAQFPDKEAIFFMDLKEGDTYRVLGCINKNTTVRAHE